MRKALVVLVAVSLLVCAASAQARTIISLNPNIGSGDALASGETAGIISVGNWNNINLPTAGYTGVSAPKAVYRGSYTGTVIDSNGNVVPIQIDYNGITSNSVNPEQVVTGSPASADAKMMTGGVGSISKGGNDDNAVGQLQVSSTDQNKTLEQIMGGSYTVYVYYGSGGNTPGWGGVGTMILSSGEYTSSTKAEAQDFPSSTVVASHGYTTNGGPPYVPSGWYVGKPTYDDAAGYTAGNYTGGVMTQGNYIQYGNVAADNLVVTAGILTGTYQWEVATILGIQLVGPAAPHLTADPASNSNLQFGTVSGDSTITGGVMITQDGDAGTTANLTGATFTNFGGGHGISAANFSISGGDEYAAMGQNDNQTFNILFNRNGLPSGNYTSDLTFTSDIGQTFTYHVSVDLEVQVIQAHLSSTPDPESTVLSPIVFDTNNGYTVSEAVSLANDSPAGANPVTLLGAEFSGLQGDRFSILFGDPNATLYRFDGMLFDIGFDPTGLSGGTYYSDMTISTDNPDQPTLTYHLRMDVPSGPIAEPAGLAIIGLGLLGLHKRRS